MFTTCTVGCSTGSLVAGGTWATCEYAEYQLLCVTSPMQAGSGGLCRLTAGSCRQHTFNDGFNVVAGSVDGSTAPDTLLLADEGRPEEALSPEAFTA